MNAAFSVVQKLVEGGRYPEAAVAARELCADQPDLVEAWLLLALAEQRNQRFVRMLEAVRRAAALRPDSPAVIFKLVEALLFCGEGGEARGELRGLEASAGSGGLMWSRIADMYSEAGAHEDRLRCARRAYECAPDERHLLASLAAAETACGKIADAEAHLDQLIARHPEDAGAQYRRSILRRQTNDRNHMAELQQRLAVLPLNVPDQIPLCYALAKECEDLGQYAQSFEYLQRGATRRKRGLTYDVAEDERALEAIARAFSARRFADQSPGETFIRLPGLDPEQLRGSAAIFVMGLPRSGTTLVDRILSSHSRVQSLGEINDFAYAILRQTQGAAGGPQGTVGGQGTAAPRSKLALIEQSATLDFAALGRDYLASVAGYGLEKPLFIDKTPWNFLYLGLIALALPGARIIHLRRHPMDSCFALYKTLFRGGSPYSYDLQDLARYYLAYEKLMQHWRTTLGGRFFEVDYERVVSAQEPLTRQLLDYCGLAFEPQCLNFHENPTPAATASAAQVREPVHTRSVANWKNYESQLAPLAAALRAGGLSL